MLLKKFDHNLLIIVSMCCSFNPFRNIINYYEDKEIFVRNREWTHEVNVSTINISIVRIGVKGMSFLQVNAPNF